MAPTASCGAWTPAARQALPAVELTLAAATRGTVVAFGAGSINASEQADWSVTVIGHSHEVTDADEISRLEQIGLSSWAPGQQQKNFIRISPGILNGRQLCALTAS